MIDLGAMPTRISSGNPSAIAKLEPTTKLLAAGVLNSGSISRRRIMPELIVPVIIPYMDTRPS